MAIAIYARKSTESEDRQVQSLEDQLQVLRSLAAREEITIAKEIIEAKSAKEPGSRPEFQALLASITDGSIDGILTWNINRLSRNMVDGGHIAHLLQSGKLSFIKTPERTYRPEDSALLLAIETGVATSFIQDLRRNVKRGMEGKATRGWMPGKAPVGYLNNSLTREIEADPIRFCLIQKAWEMLDSGSYSIAEVHREMQRLGLTGVDRQEKIGKAVFYKLFHNKFYCGLFSYGGRQWEGKHPKMVSLELFQRVQNRLGRQQQHRDPELRHPFAGIFKCAICGCAIVAETKVKRYKMTSREVSYTYYRCTGARGCRGGYIEASRLDQAVEALASQLKPKPGVREWLDHNLSEMLCHVVKQDERVVSQHTATIERLSKRLNRLREMRLDEELTQHEYMEQKLNTEFLLSNANAQLRTVSGKLKDTSQAFARRLASLEGLGPWEDTVHMAKRSFLRELSSEAFLTLDKAIFRCDEALLILFALEPPFRGSESLKVKLEIDRSLGWYSIQEVIRKLESSENRRIWLILDLQTHALSLRCDQAEAATFGMGNKLTDSKPLSDEQPGSQSEC